MLKRGTGHVSITAGGDQTRKNVSLILLARAEKSEARTDKDLRTIFDKEECTVTKIVATPVNY